jgi:pimeloyl-ACP methyl ester carboxylesterase/tellurite resistance protein
MHRMNAQTPPPGREMMARSAEAMTRFMEQAQAMGDVARRQMAAMTPAMPPRIMDGAAPTGAAFLSRSPFQLMADAMAYAVDASQRSVLFWDTMRQAGNTFAEHEKAGCPPVLVFDWDMVVDGRTLPRRCNYALVRIKPPEGAKPTDPAMRPFVIIDPRAGHGAGIGGFKSDSQVGVALRRGHPVYFVIFFRDPEPGQTILDITEAEAIFLRRIHELHPEAQRPVVIGNCQGGWAVMMLGASEPELTGPLVLNGAPLSYWAGERGRNPMRYTGGLAGGSWPAALLADLGNGTFDGANLVSNFESLSPGNTKFRKYYNLYENVDSEAERFLEFERWWGGYFLMTRDEIRWIVENLFIGDKFARGEISAGKGASFNMRSVKSPIVVFASAGDNITPPGQALRWIADVYRDEQEIKTLGQTIIYLVHDEIGHLGIFVSGKVANKEHTEIANTLDLIESVAPGLYELRITGTAGSGLNTGYQVELVEKTIGDIRAISGEAENEAFPAVARISALNQMVYDLFASPVIRQFTTEQSAELRRQMNPMRARRYMVSDSNPLMRGLGPMAEMVKANRAPAAADNPFVAMERAWADSVERSIDAWRDWRDSMQETAFHAIYGTMSALNVAAEVPAVDAVAELAGETPDVRAALDRIAEGGYAEAVVRMMILMAKARGGVRRSRLARSNTLLTTEAPFAQMTSSARQALIREQTVVVEMAPQEAFDTLATLLPDAESRQRALTTVADVAGPEEELGEPALAMLGRLRGLLQT